MIFVFGIGGLVAFNAAVLGLAMWLGRRPAVGFMDPAIREDREVEQLELIWAMPSFDPREHA